MLNLANGKSFFLSFYLVWMNLCFILLFLSFWELFLCFAKIKSVSGKSDSNFVNVGRIGFVLKIIWKTHCFVLKLLESAKNTPKQVKNPKKIKFLQTTANKIIMKKKCDFKPLYLRKIYLTDRLVVFFRILEA